jgi:SAM-dependent methyltransferase
MKDLLKSLMGGRPAVQRMPRSQYKSVWNGVSGSENDAKMAVSGYVDEDIYRKTADMTRDMLVRLVGINPTDVVLEIGAGVGRVAPALAPICKEWIGTDVSENMVAHIRNRTRDLPNVRAVPINGYDLSNIPSGSVDVVYCTVVFMHLEEFERWSYIKEGFRVLRPGGRMLVDNIDMTSDAGWSLFLEHAAIPPADRPSQISKPSTPQELESYFRRAGFAGIASQQINLWVVMHGTKPQAAA